MRKIACIISSFMFSITLCFAQSPNQLNELLSISIEKYLCSREQLIKKGILTENNLKNIIFFNDNFSNEFLSPEVVKKNNINYFNKEKYKKSELKNGIYIFRILPFVLNDSVLSVTIMDGKLYKKGRRTTIANTRGYTYRYMYMCGEKKWKLIE